MNESLSLLKKLRHDRTFYYRLFSLALFVSTQLFTIVVLQFHENGQLRHLAVMNAIVAITITTIFVFGAIDLSKRNLNFESVKSEKSVLSSRFVTSQDLLFRIDNDTRQEVGAWLHGTLQPQLTRLARDIRAKSDPDSDIFAQRVDDISEKFVRSYSHDLYPPSLIVSLEVGLETLLDGRAELILDYQLTNASNVGFSIWSPDSESEDSARPLRLVLGSERAYAIYRIVEEAVANAEKKPNTSQIVVDIRVEGEEVRISVHDNGAPISENVNPGLGLSIINAFIERFEGNLSITNVVGGVELIASIPYTPVTVADKLHSRFKGGD